MLVYRKNLKRYSQELRKNMTEAEIRLWSIIRMKQLNGYRFCRQRSIGDYIVDFYCPEAKLVIEVDGGQHYFDEAIEKDSKRDGYLMSQGLRVLRYTNTDVLENIEGVIDNILEVLDITKQEKPS